MRARIYAANLHHGGGAAGAATFVADLPALHENGDLAGIRELEVVLSTLVARNLRDVSMVERVPGVGVVVRDDFPQLQALWTRRGRASVDAELIVRGPHYVPFEGARTIVGFADRTMYYPNAEGLLQEWRGAPTDAIKRRMKRLLIRRYDEFIVQAEHLAARLWEEVAFKRVWLVPNSPSAVFLDRHAWRAVELPPSPREAVRLFYPARAYPHKNHGVIGPVGGLLESKYGIRLDVVVTLRDNEYLELSPQVKRYCTNVGEVTIDQCPMLYLACDGVFFPSLNETSSATPLEGMVLERPVFASDRAFIRETAGAVPFYFEPTSVESIARVIAGVFGERGAGSLRLEQGRKFVADLPTSFERSQQYVRILKGVEDADRSWTP